MAVLDDDLARGAGAPARSFRVRLAPALRTRRFWLTLAGAGAMALAGAVAGAQIKLDEGELQPLRGPRLRISPAATLTPASLSRDPASIGRLAC